MRKVHALSLLFLFPLMVAACLAQSSPLDSVNEAIGTANEGQTFPATGLPFAMTQWTPQTRAGNVKCVAPYYDADTRIQGFRGSHFLSGSCTQDYGSVTLMPLSGKVEVEEMQRSSAFDRATETRTPYRYAVNLKDYNIDAEVTGTLRAGLMRFRFNRGGKSWVLVQGNTAIGDGEVRIDPARGEVLVTAPVRRLYAGQGKLAGFNGYAVVRFDHPFHVGGVWSGKMRQEGGLQQQGVKGSPGAYVLFDVKAGEAVEARIGTSFTSLEEARHNLEAEIPGWDFDSVVSSVRISGMRLSGEYRFLQMLRSGAFSIRLFITPCCCLVSSVMRVVPIRDLPGKGGSKQHATSPITTTTPYGTLSVPCIRSLRSSIRCGKRTW